MYVHRFLCQFWNSFENLVFEDICTAKKYNYITRYFKNVKNSKNINKI